MVFHDSIKTLFGDLISDSLAKLPFAGYITLNPNDLLERALREEKRKYEAILDDSDLESWDFLDGEVPIIKANGTITTTQKRSAQLSPNTYAIGDFGESAEILKAVMRLIMIGKKLLFVGFDGKNCECLRLNSRFREMGNQTQNIAIVFENGTCTTRQDDTQKLCLIDMDNNTFMEKLYFAFDRHPEEVFDPLIRRLFHEKIIASETQAIDIFLSIISDKIENLTAREDKLEIQVERIIAEAQSSHDLLMNRRPVFRTFPKYWRRILEAFNTEKEKKLAALSDVIEEIKDERIEITKCIKKNRELITKKHNEGKNIFTFSQSLRVIDLLCAMRSDFQESSILYIAECRAPHATAFCDAQNITKAILDKKGKYQMVWVTDCSIFTLFRTKINIIFMGAHSILFKDEALLHPVGFINTCGTAAVVEIAHKFSIPLYVVAERDKYVKFSNAELDIVNKPARTTFDIKSEEFLEFNDTGKVEIKNIIYELCPIHKGITFLSEKDPITVQDDVDLPSLPENFIFNKGIT